MGQSVVVLGNSRRCWRNGILRGFFSSCLSLSPERSEGLYPGWRVSSTARRMAISSRIARAPKGWGADHSKDLRFWGW